LCREQIARGLAHLEDDLLLDPLALGLGPPQLELAFRDRLPGRRVGKRNGEPSARRELGIVLVEFDRVAEVGRGVHQRPVLACDNVRGVGKEPAAQVAVLVACKSCLPE
jgi:hypothetical protein